MEYDPFVAPGNSLIESYVIKIENVNPNPGLLIGWDDLEPTLRVAFGSYYKHIKLYPSKKFLYLIEYEFYFYKKDVKYKKETDLEKYYECMKKINLLKPKYNYVKIKKHYATLHRELKFEYDIVN
jgi:hypothetical protein